VTDAPRPPAAAVDADLFRLLAENVEDYAIFLLDPQGRILTWNAGAGRIKGYEAAEILGHGHARFYDEADVRAGRPQALLRAAAERGRVEDEGWRVRKDGTRFWANVVITALRGGDGGLRAFAKITRDMTDRRRHEDTLRSVVDHVVDGIVTIDEAGSSFSAISGFTELSTGRMPSTVR